MRERFLSQTAERGHITPERDPLVLPRDGTLCGRGLVWRE